MKIKPVLAGILMIALASIPVAAEACSGDKSKSDSGTTSQPVPQRETTRT